MGVNGSDIEITDAAASLLIEKRVVTKPFNGIKLRPGRAVSKDRTTGFSPFPLRAVRFQRAGPFCVPAEGIWPPIPDAKHLAIKWMA